MITTKLTLLPFLGARKIKNTPPVDARERYTLAAWLSAHLAFQVAEWHEIAQWYGFESVRGF
ncbi:DUF4056 domain-containing protein, partial [Salmonella enterica subsp. enterica serovar Kentucky]|nr:DUF4056 domain-containing protein [Salmonella enterica subsp. enterica serovar Kentucky]